jgi:hypothetical protein
MYDNRIRVFKTQLLDAIGVYMTHRTVEDKQVFAKNIEWEERQEAQLISPIFYMQIQDAQVLMDDLWAAGMRPTEGTGSAGSLSATQKHLEDMRRIAFRFIEEQ